MHKTASYILELCNYIDEKCPSLFYFIPEYYLTSAFVILKAFLKLDLGNLTFLWPDVVSAPLSYSKDILVDLAISLTIKHLADKEIPHPDLQEFFLKNMEMMLQYKDVIKKMEANSIAKEKLIYTLLLSFEMKKPKIVSRIFMRLLKGTVLNDLQYTIYPDVGSSYYREQFVNVCNKNEKLREIFLNSFFDQTNDLISEIIMNYAKRKNKTLNIKEKETCREIARKSYNILYDISKMVTLQEKEKKNFTDLRARVHRL